MKYFFKKKSIHKIILALLIICSINFVIPKRVSAVDWGNVAGSLLKEIVQFIDSLGDVVMGLLNNVMLGTDGIGSAMLDQDDANLDDGSGSWLKDTLEGDVTEKTVNNLENKFKVPNMLYSPETIFGNRIAALDVNFLRANKYTAVSDSTSASDKAQSAASSISKVIAKWYKGFRNLAIVGLLSVLVYLGIRILISTAATDKAKYKENLQDWLVALCLVFVIHFIMSGILMLSDNVTELLTGSDNSMFKVTAISENGNKLTFNTNLTGLIRLQAEGDDWHDATAYAIMYLIIIGYTVAFTIMYFKRFLYIAFLTMIAPLVALTYPIDKAGDSKAQAFNFWFKEYVMNVILQPVHLLLYMALIGAASDLVARNPLYALVAIAFLIPAEKFIKNMFGLNKASSTSDFGTFAGTALAYEGLKKLGSSISGASGKGSKAVKGGTSSSSEAEEAKFNKIRRAELGAYAANNGMNEEDNKDKENNTPRTDDNNSKELSEEQRKQAELNNVRQEKEKLGQELDQYQANGGDVYSADPEMQAKQLRYNELDAQEKAMLAKQEEQERQEARERFAASQRLQLLDVHPRERRPGAKKRMAIRAAKTIGKGALKGGLKATKIAAKGAFAVGGGTIGFAAGLGTGDLRNAIGYATAGAAAGGKIGGSIGNQVENLPNTVKSGIQSIEDGYNNSVGKIMDGYNEEMYGSKAAKDMRTERLNDRDRKRFLRDEEEQKKYDKMRMDVGYDGNLRSFMNAVADYKEVGVSDDGMIKNALKVEKNSGGISGDNHSKMIDVAKFATENGYKKSDILGNKTRSDMEDVVQTAIAPKDRYNVMKNIADLYDAGDFYSKNSRFKKPEPAPVPKSNNSGRKSIAKTNKK